VECGDFSVSPVNGKANYVEAYLKFVINADRGFLQAFCLNIKNCVCTLQEIYYISATRNIWLMLFRKVIPVYCENHITYTECRFLVF
jgi:hypothetical protein